MDNPSLIGHVAKVIADLVIDDKNLFVRALLLSYPARTLPALVLRVNDELDTPMQRRFADVCEDLAVGD